MNELRAPFSYFGGKSKVASDVWKLLGNDLDFYVEPFAGSLAVLLGRPEAKGIEIANDLDMYITNFWRAVQYNPEEVAKFADSPINEIDLTSRHLWLITEGYESLKKLWTDPLYYDSKIAGWWVWGQCSWIASGWCDRKGPWSLDAQGNLNKVKDHPGVYKKRPVLSGGIGIFSDRLLHENLPEYLKKLAFRLRDVKILCGDWERTLTDGCFGGGDIKIGIFLDPPYTEAAGRKDNLYSVDSLDVGTEVYEWVMNHCNDNRFRIALCGYDGEYAMPVDWYKYTWTARAAYQGHNANGKSQENRKKEVIWFSPNCNLKEITNEPG